MKKATVFIALLFGLLVSGSCAPDDSNTSFPGNSVPEEQALNEQNISTTNETSFVPRQTDETTTEKKLTDEEYDELLEKYKDDPVKWDAAMSAKLQGITFEEALFQLTKQVQAGNLQAELEKREPATFAGFWVQQQPEFRLFAAFTQGGNQTLEKYRDEFPELVKITAVVTLKYPLRQLLSMQDSTCNQLRAIGLKFSTGIDIARNRIKIYVTDRESFDSIRKEHGIYLFDCVDVVVVDALPQTLLKPSN